MRPKRMALVAVVVFVIVLGLFAYFLVEPIGAYCSRSVEGTALNVKVVKDNQTFETPVSGAIVTGSYILTCTTRNPVSGAEGQITETISIGQFTTPSNGSIAIPSPNVGNYTLTVSYYGRTYEANVSVLPLKSTNITVTLSSGLVNTSYS